MQYLQEFPLVFFTLRVQMAVGTVLVGKCVLGNDADRALLKKIMQEQVLPKWAARCSASCVQDFNATIGKVTGLTAKK